MIQINMDEMFEIPSCQFLMNTLSIFYKIGGIILILFTLPQRY